jgi:hypothetical protein
VYGIIAQREGKQPMENHKKKNSSDPHVLMIFLLAENFSLFMSFCSSVPQVLEFYKKPAQSVRFLETLGSVG